jgi:hypothetical protein
LTSAEHGRVAAVTLIDHALLAGVQGRARRVAAVALVDALGGGRNRGRQRSRQGDGSEVSSAAYANAFIFVISVVSWRGMKTAWLAHARTAGRSELPPSTAPTTPAAILGVDSGVAAVMHDADDPLSHRRPQPFDQPSNRPGTSGRSGRSGLCGWIGFGLRVWDVGQRRRGLTWRQFDGGD